MADLDYIIKKLFMNVTVTDQKVTKITQNSPFRELCLDADSAMVTPRRAVMNYLKQARELMPVMTSWNGEVARFLERPRGVQTLAVTY